LKSRGDNRDFPLRRGCKCGGSPSRNKNAYLPRGQKTRTWLLLKSNEPICTAPQTLVNRFEVANGGTEQKKKKKKKKKRKDGSKEVGMAQRDFLLLEAGVLGRHVYLRDGNEKSLSSQKWSRKRHRVKASRNINPIKKGGGGGGW